MSEMETSELRYEWAKAAGEAARQRAAAEKAEQHIARIAVENAMDRELFHKLMPQLMKELGQEFQEAAGYFNSVAAPFSMRVTEGMYRIELDKSDNTWAVLRAHEDNWKLQVAYHRRDRFEKSPHDTYDIVILQGALGLQCDSQRMTTADVAKDIFLRVCE